MLALQEQGQQVLIFLMLMYFEHVVVKMIHDSRVSEGVEFPFIIVPCIMSS